MNQTLQLILGGARSGKSRYALNQGDEGRFEKRIFIATAFAGDEEMRLRIERHQKDRAGLWQTVEEPYHLIEALERQAVHREGVVIVDCTTLWISNMLCGMGGKILTMEEIEMNFDRFVTALSKMKCAVRIVSNEVGLGVVPDNLLGRQFRDLQGQLNQSVASIATQVVSMVAGIPVKIK